MRIVQVNNLNFNAKLKLKKPNNKELAKAIASTAIGATSTAIGVDFWHSGIDYGSAVSFTDSMLSVKEIQLPDGRVQEVYNEKMESSILPTMLYIIPSGAVMCGIGSVPFIENDCKNGKSIPD